MKCRLDRPAMGAVEFIASVEGWWVIDLDLDDRQADGRTCIRCGERAGSMVPVGWVERPDDVLRRLDRSSDARTCHIFAHVECAEAPLDPGDVPAPRSYVR